MSKDMMHRNDTAAETGGEVRTGVGVRTTITLSISAEDKFAVKSYALRQGKTVSDLLHGWIQEHCFERD